MTHMDHVVKKKLGGKGPPGVHPWGSLINPPYFWGWMFKNPRSGYDFEKYPYTAKFVQIGQLEPIKS